MVIFHRICVEDFPARPGSPLPDLRCASSGAASGIQKRETSSIWVKAIIIHQPELFGHLGMISLINHDSSEVTVRSL